ncbi:MAG: hypothetical protein L3J12_01050 [Spirochaetales bacterium]|nr:hypothetical protein [Spirochaetales bacterium]
MEIKKDKYSVEYIRKNRQITFKGILRLLGKDEYREIFELLTQAANETTGLPLKLDMSALQFLNSSGISSLSMFIIKMRQLDKDITMIGNNNIPWQEKSLRNFQKLYGKVEIIFS